MITRREPNLSLIITRNERKAVAIFYQKDIHYTGGKMWEKILWCEISLNILREQKIFEVLYHYYVPEKKQKKGKSVNNDLSIKLARPKKHTSAHRKYFPFIYIVATGKYFMPTQEMRGCKSDSLRRRFFFKKSDK